MNKLSDKKVGKKIKNQTFGPIPEYEDWDEAETKAADRCLEDIKVMGGMERMVLDFGHDYKEAIRVATYHQPFYEINTDKGLVKVDIANIAIQKKSWWQRHFSGNRNAEVVVAIHLHATRDLEGKHYELNKYTSISDITNITDLVMAMAYKERAFANHVYYYGGVEFK